MITRAQAADHLQYQFSALASEIGQAETDESATGYGPDIDQALRQLGESEAGLAAATVADAYAPAFLALAEYYALRRFGRQLALSADLSSGTMSKKASQRSATIKALTAEAAERAAGMGYPVGGAAAWGTGLLNLDYLEPTP